MTRVPTHTRLPALRICPTLGKLTCGTAINVDSLAKTGKILKRISQLLDLAGETGDAAFRQVRGRSPEETEGVDGKLSGSEASGDGTPSPSRKMNGVLLVMMESAGRECEQGFEVESGA